MLLRNSGVTIIAIITLALGIGANTAIFSVVNAVLLRPLPYRDADRLVALSEDSPQVPGMSISYPNLLDWQEQNQVFESIAAYVRGSFNLTGANEPERLQGRSVSPSFFSTLGVKPALGRDFAPKEDEPGALPVVILDYGLWQRRFGADPRIIGQTLSLNNESFTVIGVAPAGFRFGRPMDLYVPLILPPEVRSSRGDHPGMYAIARLKPNVTIERARADMNTIAARLRQQYKENAGNSVAVTTLLEDTVGDVRPALLILLGAVGFVLLIACANVANLLLARAATRAKEIAIRRALGAGRWRIIRQLLTESVLLALLGGALGLFLAIWGVDLLVALSPADSIPRAQEIGLDGRVLGFTLAVSLLTGVLFGLIPALQASKTDLTESLKEGGRSSTEGLRRNRVRSLLVISEIALSLVLLIGAGLMLRSFWRVQEVDPGFNPHNVLTMRISLPAAKYAQAEQVMNFYQTTIERVKGLPGVQAVGVSGGIPLSGAPDTSFFVEGRPYPPAGRYPEAFYYTVSPEYFRAMGIRLLKGRYFTEQDAKDSPKVTIIDENLARGLFAGQDPIGKHLVPPEGGADPPSEIVGVVQHVKHMGLDSDAQSKIQYQFYVPYVQIPEKYLALATRDMYLVARTANASDPLSLAAPVQKEIHEVDKNQPVFNVKTMEQLINESIAPRRFSMFLLSLFALVALVLAAVGIYGVMSYSVSQRTHEIGIRVALGAGKSDVLKLVIKQGLTLALIGVVSGLIGALVVTRVMASMLYGVTATDPLVFAGVALLLALVALLACYIPAHRAMRVDPMIALRYE
jgi:putative ABC transport system permease protein